MLQGTNIDVEDASTSLGSFMLQGWTMTDMICPHKDCPTPMLRSKDGSITFCVVHDPSPIQTSSSSSSIATPPPVPAKKIDVDESKIQADRRSQSDKASKLIGERLLQRWALLNDICSNPSCYAVPLMRHPQDKTMQCVICEQSYIAEADVEAHKRSASESTTVQNEQVSDMVIEPIDPPVPVSAPVPPAKTFYTPTGLEPAINTLIRKVNDLVTAVAGMQDPVKIQKHFETIQAGAAAIQACAQASEACIHIQK